MPFSARLAALFASVALLSACSAHSPAPAALTTDTQAVQTSVAAPIVTGLTATATDAGLSCTVNVTNSVAGDVTVEGSAGDKATDFGAHPLTSGTFTWFGSIDATTCSVTVTNNAGKVVANTHLGA